MEVKFRLANFSDLESIIRLCNECFQEETSMEYATKIFKETEHNDDHLYLIGEVDGKIVAHSKITVIKTIYEKMNIYAILNHVCVKPEYRRGGIATKMLDEITRLCLERNVKTLELWSNNVRIPAHACYLAYGFHLDDAGFFSKNIV